MASVLNIIAVSIVASTSTAPVTLTATGAKAGDKLLGFSDDSGNGFIADASSSLFERIISVSDQVQQTSDIPTADSYTLYLVRPIDLS